MLINYIKNRPLIVLLPLLIGQLAVLSLQVKDKEGTTLLKRTVLNVVSPFLLVSHTVSSFVTHVLDEYVRVREVRNENEELKRKLADLTFQAQQNAALAQKTKRLQSLLDLRQSTSFKTRTANVIGRTPSLMSFGLILDRGAADGVKKDNPVIVAEGVVGRVVYVMSNTCEVQALLDYAAAAGALVARTRVQCVLNGRGGLLMKLNYLLNHEDVLVGDMVSTSGIEGIYPMDLPLGQVVRVANGESVFKDVDVLPMVNVNQVEEVLILLDASPKP
jgi:rod shape-determining protein MreC